MDEAKQRGAAAWSDHQLTLDVSDFAIRKKLAGA
jgi:hypothetical protein